MSVFIRRKNSATGKSTVRNVAEDCQTLCAEKAAAKKNPLPAPLFTAVREIYI